MKIRELSRKKKIVIFCVFGAIALVLWTVFGVEYVNNTSKGVVDTEFLPVLYENSFGIDSAEVARLVDNSKMFGYPLDEIGSDKYDELIPTTMNISPGENTYDDFMVVIAYKKSNIAMRFYVVWNELEFMGIVPIDIKTVNKVVK